jgi:hypothetical protein
MTKWWITTPDQELGSIVADNYIQADLILFRAILDGKYPVDVVLIEELVEEEIELDERDFLDQK